MTERGFIFKIVKKTEEKFGCICYSYKDSNTPKTYCWWNVCIDDYDSYTSNDFKNWSSCCHAEAKKVGINILFCYCNPLESKLVELAEQDNLIMNI